MSALTFNLFLREQLLFPKKQADLCLCPGLVGHKHPRVDLGAMKHQYMVNIDVKSPVRQVLFPPNKHEGKTKPETEQLRNICQMSSEDD